MGTSLNYKMIEILVDYKLNISETADRSAPIPAAETDDSQMVNPRRSLEEEYLDYEAQVKKK